MRLLSRLGTWLRISARQPAVTRDEDPTLPGSIPRTPAVSFRRNLLESLEQAQRGQKITLRQLDPSVQALIVPVAVARAKDGDARVAAEVDVSLARVEASGRTLLSLTWSALRDSRPPFQPGPSMWASELRLHDEVGLLFFVDLEAIAVGMQNASEAVGFSARVEDEAALVRVSDGRYEAHVTPSALLAEALWTGCGPLDAIARRAQALSAEMRSFASLLRGLERRFPGLRFETRGGHFVATGSTQPPRTLDYRHLSAAARAAGLPMDAWLARLRLDDLFSDQGDIAVLVRSPAYQKAYPDALARTVVGATLVAVREADGRATPVKAYADDAIDRFDHFSDEARRQLPFFSFIGHVFVLEQPTPHGLERIFVLVGDKAATIAFHGELVRGLLEQLAPIGAEVTVRAFSENTAAVSSTTANDVLIAEARLRASQLEADLFDDGSDAVEYERRVVLPDTGAGRFELTLVLDRYFQLLDQVTTRADISPGHADYVRGLALEILDLTDKAAIAFERAVRASSEDGEMALALGRPLSALGQ